MTSLATNLRDAAGQYPGKAAVRLDDTVLTYADVDDRTARVAGWLRGRGMQAGDRIAIMLPNVLAFPLLYYGALRAVVVPMNPLLKAREARRCVTRRAEVLLRRSGRVADGGCCPGLCRARRLAASGPAGAGRRGPRLHHVCAGQTPRCST